ncbi:MAG: gamma-glutamyltransferase [Verrucomicrobia bacterium]|nr:gamma-glutamyltransferase [Verrucomicrobiota bacterium]
MTRRAVVALHLSFALCDVAGVPVEVTPVRALSGMVVAGHPQAAEAGLAVLQSGGNAVDAAVTTSLALGVAEPYGSGLGGKLMMLFFEARTGRVYAVDGMDAAGSIEVAEYRKRPATERSYGYPAVCVPGLGAALWAAHQRWGVRKWSDNLEPAIALARAGFRVLPRNREHFREQEKKLRRGDPEIARLYLPGGRLPEVGELLPNEDLARTMEAMARFGRNGFYQGAVAEAVVAAVRAGGGAITAADLADYEARIGESLNCEFRGFVLCSGPPPTSGAALFLPILKILEGESFGGRPLRWGGNLDRIGRAWREVHPQIERTVGDVPESRFLVEKVLAPDSIGALRARAFGERDVRKRKVAAAEPSSRLPVEFDGAMAATTHFIVVDREGNIVCATQSQSLHFGAGVVPPGTGVIMNNSMSNFNATDPKSLNYVAPGKRPRSTIGPTIVLRDGRPVLAVGAPGSSRIPTALLQVLLDRLALQRPLEEAIGDLRIHFQAAENAAGAPSFEVERPFPEGEVEELRRLGWRVVLRERAGTGSYFGGVNAVEIDRAGSRSGFADPRRTNVAVGY